MRHGQMNPGMSCEPCPTQACAINHLETMWAVVCVCLDVLGALTSLGDTAGPLFPWGSCAIALILATLQWQQGALHPALVGFRRWGISWGLSFMTYQTQGNPRSCCHSQGRQHGVVQACEPGL